MSTRGGLGKSEAVKKHVRAPVSEPASPTTIRKGYCGIWGMFWATSPRDITCKKCLMLYEDSSVERRHAMLGAMLKVSLEQDEREKQEKFDRDGHQ